MSIKATYSTSLSAGHYSPALTEPLSHGQLMWTIVPALIYFCLLNISLNYFYHHHLDIAVNLDCDFHVGILVGLTPKPVLTSENSGEQVSMTACCSATLLTHPHPYTKPLRNCFKSFQPQFLKVDGPTDAVRFTAFLSYSTVNWLHAIGSGLIAVLEPGGGQDSRKAWPSAFIDTHYQTKSAYNVNRIIYCPSPGNPLRLGYRHSADHSLMASGTTKRLRLGRGGRRIRSILKHFSLSNCGRQAGSNACYSAPFRPRVYCALIPINN